MFTMQAKFPAEARRRKDLIYNGLSPLRVASQYIEQNLSSLQDWQQNDIY